MLSRVAACAALLLCSPVLAGTDRPPTLKPAIVIAEQEDGLTQQRGTGLENPAADNEASSQWQAYAATPLAPAQSRPTDPPPPAAIDAEPGPFGLETKSVAFGAILSKWSGVEAEIKAGNEVLARCRTGAWCPQAARDFLDIVDAGRMRSGRARIGVINRAINLAIVPTTDLTQWGVPDRWSAPLETFTSRRGDCEDYAIAKYVALKAAGIADQDVRLVIVRNAAPEESHAVVAVRLDAAWIILDNRWLALVRDNEIWRATPLFVLDDNGVRQLVSPAAAATQRDVAPSSL